MYPLLRGALFCLNAERAHDLTLTALQTVNRGPIGSWIKRRVADAPVDVMGIRFPNPVGLCAGLDKNGDYIAGLGNLGFGSIEIGTITPLAQPGNPKPRIFRLPEHQAIINRMGFNNAGVEQLIDNVTGSGFSGVLGINIGKNLTTPVEEANDDYLKCVKVVYPHASYITVNVSSPNTPGLRQLQHGNALEALFGELKDAQKSLAEQHKKYIPLAIKIAPDLESSEIKGIADAIIRNDIDAVIATNTTNSREVIGDAQHANETGGLSGAPLTTKSTEVVRELVNALSDKTPVIAAGGIMTGRDALEKINAGAQLVQLYSGLIYRGPSLIRECVNAIRDANIS